MNRFIFDFFVSVKKTNEDFAAAKSLIFASAEIFISPSYSGKVARYGFEMLWSRRASDLTWQGN